MIYKMSQNGDVSDELLSDEEITSYQVPRHDIPCDPLNTSDSPYICALPSSLKSSVKSMPIPECNNPIFLPTAHEEMNQQSCNAPDVTHVYKSLGMVDKDVSWVSSMESLVADGSFRADYNTIEKATFFPDPSVAYGSQIQPRALFPSSSNESLCLKVLDSSFESDIAKPYSREMRLSDVCDVLKTLNVMGTTRGSDENNENKYDFMVGGPSLLSSVEKPEASQLLVDVGSRITKCEEEVKDSVISNSSLATPLRRIRVPNFCKEPDWNVGDSTVIFENSVMDNFNASAIKPLPEMPSSPVSINHLRCSSPSVFSPEVKSNKLFQPVEVEDPNFLTPIKSNSLEGSQLEIALDESLPRGCSTPLGIASRKSGVLSDGSHCLITRHVSEVAEKPEMERGTNKKSSAAHCPELLPETSEITPSVDVSVANPILKEVPAPVVKSINKISKGRNTNQHKSKRLYGPSVEVASVDILEDDIFKALKDSEIISSQFLNDFQVVKSKPKSTGLVPFNVLIEDELKETEKSTLKRSRALKENPSEVNEVETTISGSKFAVPAIPAETQFCKRLKLETSTWSSKANYLVDSQADVSDTQIFQAVENLESSIAADVSSGDLLPGLSLTPRRKPRRKLINRNVKKVHELINSVTVANENCPLVNSKFSTTPSVSKLNVVEPINEQDVPILKEPCNNLTLEPQGFAGFVTGNKKMIKPSGNSLKKAMSILEDADDDSLIKNETVANVSKHSNISSGNVSGNLQAARPSGEALLRVKNISKDCGVKISENRESCQSDLGFEDFKAIQNNQNCGSANGTTKTLAGFMTRNMKALKPSAAACLKAQHLFEDEKEVISKLTGGREDKIDTATCSLLYNSQDHDAMLVQGSYDKGGTSTLSGIGKNNILNDTHTVPEINYDCKDSKALINQDSLKNKKTYMFQGFRTGNNSVIKPSEESLAKVKKMLDACENEMVVDQPKDECKKSKEVELAPPIFQGFRTGNNSVIKPSDESLAKVRKMLDACENEMVVNHPKYECQKSKEVELAPPTFQGFRTGNNNVIKPSDESLAKVRKMLDACENEMVVNQPKDECEQSKEVVLSPPIFQGFRTGNNSVIKPSDESLAKVRKMLDACENEMVVNQPKDECQKSKEIELAPPMFQGFRTGNNSVIKPSEESLAKVKKMLDACENKEVVNQPKDECQKSKEVALPPPMFQGFRTGNNNVIKPSDESLAKVKKMLDACENKEVVNQPKDECEQSKEVKLAPPMFQGFRTGNNSVIKPSDESLAKVKKMLDACENEMVVNQPKDECEQSKEVELAPPIFQACRTGNNSVIKPSEESLAKVKKMLDACENKEVVNQPRYECEKSKEVELAPPMFQGFRTGNNSVIKPSEESLARVKKMLDACENKDVVNQPRNDCEQSKEVELAPHKFQGFRTGNNSFIKPSEESLARVRNMLDTFENDEKVKPSDKRKKKEIVKMRFSESSLENDKMMEPSGTSFPTDRNPFLKRKYLESSLDTCRNQSEQPQAFLGFRTGNDQVVKPSEEALEKVRGMLVECEESTNHNIVEQSILGSQERISPALKDCPHPREDHGVLGNLCDSTIECPKKSLKVGEVFSGVDALQHLTAVRNSDNPVRSSSPKNKRQAFQGQQNASIVSSREATTHTSVLDQSYSTLLENTDWDDTIVPSWFHSSQSKSITSDLPLATKRPPDEMEDTPSRKKQKHEAESEISQCIKEKRQQKRNEQVRQGRKKAGTVRPVIGSHLRRKLEESQYTWQQAMPQGPELLTVEQLRALGVQDYVLDVTAENTKFFRFQAKHFYNQSTYESNTDGLPVGDGFLLILDDDNCAGVEEVERAFLAGPGVAPELVPAGWVPHHYGLLVWKFACYERSCPRVLAGQALNPQNIMLQLKYRYDCEVDRSKSSALKRIMERDDAAGKTLVLTVMHVSKLVEGYELLLTDGWYTCPARTDCAMSRAVQSGKLTVGTKIMTQGAELVGCEQGAPPLERPAGAHLKISTNSTRRVKWYHKLGFQKLRCPPPVSLSSIIPGGGIVGCVRVAVVRVYPLVFVEKTAEGRSVTRSIRAEEKASAVFQQKQEAIIEKLCSQIQNELSSKKRTNSSRRSAQITSESLASICSPEELCAMLENTQDPSNFETLLNDDQKEIVWKYQESRRFKAGRELQEKMAAAKMQQRSVRSVLRVKVVDISGGEQSAVLSWWQPTEDLLSVFVEERALSLFNVLPGNNRNQQQLYLNSTRQTRVEPLPAPQRCLPSRTVLRVSDISSSFVPVLGELDVVGLVVYIHNVTQGPSTMQTVYLSDSDENFFGLVFWRGLQEFCCEDTLAEGLVVGASNVQWRRTSSSAVIPCGYVTETTLFTLNSKSPLIKNALDELKQELEEVDLPRLIERCQDQIITRLNTYKNQSNTSTNSSLLMSDMSLDGTSLETKGSPAPRPRYLNGFAQRPRAASTPVKPVQWRIDKLEQMGNPPALSPITATKGGRWSRSYKLPTVAESPPMDL